MQRILIRLGLIVTCATMLLACGSPTLDPDELPYRLEKVRDFGLYTQTADLDGDGKDEVLLYHTPSADLGGVEALWLKNHDGQTIEQVNYEGRLLPAHVLDVMGDERQEILLPFIRSDSLFLSVLDAHGQKRLSFFLTRGAPRKEPAGTIPWDPFVQRFFVSDLDGDGQQELITILSTGLARSPRGVFVHRLPEGTLVGAKTVGAFLSGKSVLDDLDGDGKLELVVATFAPNNGASEGGFDDQHSYLIVFQFTPAPRIVWSREQGNRWSGLGLGYDDLDGDGTRELLLTATTSSSNPAEARFELVEPGTWRTLRARTYNEPFGDSHLVDLNHDATPEIVVVRYPDEVWVLDSQFTVRRRRRIASGLNRFHVWPDVDGDGVDELVLTIHEGNDFVLLSPELDVKATYPAKAVMGLMRRGVGVRPYLLATEEDPFDGKAFALDLTPNPLYGLYRYGPTVLGLLGVLVVVAVTAGVHRLYRRRRLMEEAGTAALDLATEGFLLLDPQGRILRINPTLCGWLGFDEAGRIEGVTYGEVFGTTPALASFLHEALRREPRQYDDEFALPGNGRERPVHVTMVPLSPEAEGRPHWLIAFHERSSKRGALDARAWAMMARKVTHDIKNPLTNILLTTQRLQSEYHRRVPASEAAAFDAYAERIIDRVTQLRRTAKQFMKVLDGDALELVKTDVSTFVCSLQDELRRDLPPDVDLILEVPSDEPAVILDREQMQSVLDNLVANAVQALPGGGRITISTYSVSNLRSGHADYVPKDYVVLEVQDNGRGIPKEDQARLFEPGFTTSEFGTGLGLALVKKAIEHHGGFIEVESEPGVGSVFSLHLPVAPEPMSIVPS
ncbi:MAG: PAS domain-containing protein [Bacteroidetes bacterium]|jgi:signal transduction histidine kinase|nr:PAS domain-containing protein [Bacteroidota bacterium]